MIWRVYFLEEINLFKSTLCKNYLKEISKHPLLEEDYHPIQQDLLQASQVFLNTLQ